MAGFCIAHEPSLRVSIKGEFKWCVRTSQEKSCLLVLLVRQVVQKTKGVTQAAQYLQIFTTLRTTELSPPRLQGLAGLHTFWEVCPV